MDTEPVNLRMHREMIDAVEAFRREQDVIPSRPEAIRRIIRDWLIGHGYLADSDE